MKLIVGLGNPGKEYEKTRHNAGFMVVDRLAQRHAITGAKTKFRAGMLEGQIAGDKCVLLQPVTFMNRSGQSVSEAVNFYKLNTEDLLIIVDDTALPVGKLRLRAAGSAGGHNGLADIQNLLGTSKYSRLRVGVGDPGRAKQRDYVLGRFSKEEMEELEPALARACDAVECWIREGITEAMNGFNASE